MSAPVLTKEARERLENVARRWPSGMRVGEQSDWLPATPYDVVCALAHIDALEAENAKEHEELVNALVEWRRAVEVTVPALEARVAVLAAECRAWREREKFYAVGNVSVQWGQATHAVSVARAETDANGGIDG